MNKALNVANFIISYGTKRAEPITNLRLQKLLYFTWVGYFKAHCSYLFNDFMFAWQFGPVVPSVYYEYCPYGGMPIDPITDDFSHDYDILCPILDDYLAIPTSKLVAMTHEPGKPWDCIYKKGIGNGKIIPFDLIKRLECGCIS